MVRPEWRYFAIGTFFSVLLGFSGPLFPNAVVNPLFDLIIAKKQFELIPEVLLKASLLLAVSIGAYYAQNTCFALGGTRFGQRARQDVFSAMLRASPLNAETNYSSGGRTARLSLDLRELENFYIHELPILTGQGLTIIIAFTMLFMQNPQLTLGLILTTIPLGFVLVWVGKRIQRAFQRTQDATERATAAMSESLSRLDVIKTFRLEDLMLGRFATQNKIQANASLSRANWTNLSSPVSQLTVGLGIGVLVWLALDQIKAGQMTSVSLTVYLTMLVIVIAPLQLFTFAYSRLSAMRDPVNSIDQALNTPAEQQTGHLEQPALGWQGDIRFENVAARYPNAPELALQNLSFTAGSGEIIAFVGASGSGKTTLTRLLLRLLEPESGQITLDGHLLQSYRHASVRSAIAFVPQQPGLFSGSIAENLRLAQPQASQEALWQVLEAAGLDLEIRAMNLGLDTQLGEGGTGLSGGQQQRLAIARALLTGAKILILDEPTSALDAHSEALIRTTLERLRGQKTVLIIAHRLSTIENADRILVMQHGQLIEQGSHQTLLRLGGFYQALLNAHV